VAQTDVLILNASVQYRTPWQEITTQECYDQFNCNFVSSMILIQSVVDHMREEGWGRVITIGSVQETKPHPDMLVYSASKAAQTNMMQSLSLQLAKDGITVNNVAPGVIYTDRNVGALSDPEYAKKVTESIPVGFYGEPKDCAGIVSLLCSDDGRYITGQSIYVDGGKSVQ
jgi:NAD(P)-dependent dehydrogenase (short-subunit alcohol dehydrogenase family)